MAVFAIFLPHPSMVSAAREISEELNMNLAFCKYIYDENILEEASLAQSLGANIFVARGLHSSILKERTSIPVVDISLTGQEIGLLLKQAKDQIPNVSNPKVGIVTYKNMISSVEYFNSIFDIDLHTYLVENSSDFSIAASKAISDSMDIILGGKTVQNICNSKGIPFLFLNSTNDSLKSSLKNALKVGYALDTEKKNTAHLQALIGGALNGIIELDKNGIVSSANEYASSILNTDSEVLIGKSIYSMMPASDSMLLNDTMSSGTELFFSQIIICGVNTVLNCAPIKVDDESYSYVLSFYAESRLQSFMSAGLNGTEKNANRTFENFKKLRYASKNMGMSINLAHSFSMSYQPLLLQGEIGLEYSVIAGCIHNSSPYANGPFITYKCGSEADLSEAINTAEGGSLYISNLELSDVRLQLSISSYLSSFIFSERRSSVRIICSVVGNIHSLFQYGNIVKELYYILSPLTITIPALRNRPEDLNLAIDKTLSECCNQTSKKVKLAKDALQYLQSYSWPGNYLQLNSFFERLVLSSKYRTIGKAQVQSLLSDVYPQEKNDDSFQPASELTIPQEAEEIKAALVHNGGNKKQTAEELNISTTTLWRKINKYHLSFYTAEEL